MAHEQKSLADYFYWKHLSISAENAEIVTEAFLLVTNLTDLVQEVYSSLDAARKKQTRKTIVKNEKELNKSSKKIIKDVIENKDVEECLPVYRRAKQNFSNNQVTPFKIVYAWNIVENVLSTSAEAICRFNMFEYDGKTYFTKPKRAHDDQFCFHGSANDIEELTELTDFEENVFMNPRAKKEIMNVANVLIGFTIRDAESVLDKIKSIKIKSKRPN